MFARNRNRETIWPTPDPTTFDIQLSAPDPGRYDRYGSISAPNKRWTGAFDTEARASRMSFLVDSTLLPRAPGAIDQHEQWTGRRARRRQAWLAPVNQVGATNPVWSGECDDGRRPSWAGPESGALEADDEIALLKEKEQFLVQWEEGDVENPLNFAKGRKWMNAMILAFACFMVSIASSGFSQGVYPLKWLEKQHG
jgi:hypothetical protein